MHNKTAAISTLPAYAWTDWVLSMPAYSRLPLMAVVFAAFVAFSHWLTGDVYAVTGLVFSLTTLVLWTAAWVILAQGAQSDLQLLSSSDLAAELAPRPLHGLIETVIGLVLGFAVILVLAMSIVSLRLDAVSVMSALLWILVLWSGVTAAHLFGFIIRQCRVFVSLAKSLEMSLSHHEHAQIIANPLLRYALLLVLMAVVEGVLIQLVQPNVREIIVTSVLGPSLLLMLPVLVFFLWPILIVRARMQSLKERELSLVRLAMAGNRESLLESELKDVAGEFRLPDLMYYEDRIAKIWEWPIEKHRQRLIFYTLIPPAAWVMAALVERLLDTALN